MLFWGRLIKFSFEKFLPQSRFGGGVHQVCVFWGGSTWDWPKMGGVSIRRPKGAKLVHPPPSDVFDTFPKEHFCGTNLSTWKMRMGVDITPCNICHTSRDSAILAVIDPILTKLAQVLALHSVAAQAVDWQRRFSFSFFNQNTNSTSS